MNIFNKFRKQPAPVAPQVAVAPTIPANHISPKKKNTYTVTFNVMAQLELFDGCKNTPLPVITLNGKQQNNNGGWMAATEFPNPGAADMAKQHKIFAEVFGDKISTTIIEYLDKETGKPVVQVYPNMLHIFDEFESDYLQHLNHASRQDLQKQIALRERLINEYIAKQQLQK